MAFQRYLAEEVAIDHADGVVPRREALRRLALLGVGVPAAPALLAACGGDGAPAPAATSAAAAPAVPRAWCAPRRARHTGRGSPSGRARAARPALVDGAAGAVWAPHGRPRVVFGFTVRDGKIVQIDILADPERLRRLDLVVLGR
jgi:hypothetical protein